MKDKHPAIPSKMILFFVAALLFWRCEGPPGPAGPPGSDGLDGVNIVGEVFEIVADFVPESDFRIRGEYGFDILESDKVLIYRLDATDSEGVDIWRLIPQVVFHEEGIFVYDYDFTYFDYTIFLNGEADFNNLEPALTDEQIFRVLILPADRIDVRMDYTDHEAVLDMLDIKEADIQRIKLNE
ncbi:hypothetical protein SAMN04488057_105326 [Cyclobacterium lianum]|uniref:Uncharacterized protein n=1 Tax=Cyclobacterium lianum TaxID=388280 RepID=A0A1M7NH17_9BACT|nr:hypothetical protein [Cyclobacterium lianum]SHN03129.1 hypothetical protein SAMN04488057_105326 [Cyclobacterium lianum]